MDATRRRTPNNPTAAERVQIERRIRLLPLMDRTAPGTLDWPTLAGRLAEELGCIAARLADVPGASDADREHVERARIVLRDYRTARGEADA